MFALDRFVQRSETQIRQPVDVCLIAEGSYPHIAGGVSSWIDWLMRTQESRTFAVVSVVVGAAPRPSKYAFPANLTHIAELDLQAKLARSRIQRRPVLCHADELAEPLINLIRGGGLAEFCKLNEIVNEPGREMTREDLLDSDLSFDVVRRIYDTVMPHASFVQFYWAFRALFGGLFAILKFKPPTAAIYHTISTGYAGLLAARATLTTGKPAVVTEHGIYTNERRIEILMADWISDSVEKGLSLNDPRTDLRDVWINVFESYARICYEASRVITTLYRDNQHQQIVIGADPEKLSVIANGIDVKRFANVPCASAEAPPTMALIGRVVPIKDVKTFITSVALARNRLPRLKALVLGPTDEDVEYFAECKALVDELNLAEVLTFTGNVKIADFMSSIHVVVLTSLSEAQPLVLLEAGAAGIPCVATNVGSCREIIEGTLEGDEPGGFVTDLVAPEQLAEATIQLLSNPGLRERLGENLRQRVRQRYASDLSRDKYAALYANLAASSVHSSCSGGN